MIAMKMMVNREDLNHREGDYKEIVHNLETGTREGMTHLTISEVDQVRVAVTEVDAKITSQEEEGWRNVVQHFMMGQTSSQRKKS